MKKLILWIVVAAFNFMLALAAVSTIKMPVAAESRPACKGFSVRLSSAMPVINKELLVSLISSHKQIRDIWQEYEWRVVDMRAYYSQHPQWVLIAAESSKCVVVAITITERVASALVGVSSD